MIVSPFTPFCSLIFTFNNKPWSSSTQFIEMLSFSWLYSIPLSSCSIMYPTTPPSIETWFALTEKAAINNLEHTLFLMCEGPPVEKRNGIVRSKNKCIFGLIDISRWLSRQCGLGLMVNSPDSRVRRPGFRFQLYLVKAS